MGRRVPQPPGLPRSSPSCLPQERSQSSFPYSPAQGPKLPDCFFPVCVSSSLLLICFCFDAPSAALALVATSLTIDRRPPPLLACFDEVLARFSKTMRPQVS